MSRDITCLDKLYHDHTHNDIHHHYSPFSANEPSPANIHTLITNNISQPIDEQTDLNKTCSSKVTAPSKPVTRSSSSMTRAQTKSKCVTFEQLDNYALISTTNKHVRTPYTLSEAWHNIDHDEQGKWIDAITNEITQFDDKKSWTVCDREPNCKEIGVKWVFKIKRDGIYIARLVALGYSQSYGINYQDTYSPVINDISFRLILLMKLKKGWNMHRIDVKTAFLNTNLDSDIDIYIHEGLKELGINTENKIGKLNAAMYGLKQAACKFNEELSDKLINKCKLTRSKADSCVFTSKELVLGMYIYDMLITGNAEAIKLFEHNIEQQYSIRIDNIVTEFLGMDVNIYNEKIEMRQSNVIQKLLDRFYEEIVSLKEYATPVISGFTTHDPLQSYQPLKMSNNLNTYLV